MFALEFVAVHSVPVYQWLLHLIHCVHISLVAQPGFLIRLFDNNDNISVSISLHLVAQSVFVIRRPIRVFHNERMQK